MTPDLKEELAKHGGSMREWYRGVYLHSDHWKHLRLLAIKTNGRKCAKCPAKKKLDVHHLNYRNIFDVTVADLQVLCRPCHSAEHPKPENKPKIPLVVHSDTGAERLTMKQLRKLHRKQSKQKRRELREMAELDRHIIISALKQRIDGIPLTDRHLLNIRWTSKNAGFFGLRYPLKKGWKKKLLGIRVSPSDMSFLMKPR